MINKTTSPIRIFKENIEIGRASGFFFTRNEKKYFITNRHVVIKENEKFYPDTIKLRLHLSEVNLNLNNELTIKLYDENGNKNWLEHFDYSNIQCDIIAIPLNEKVLDRTNFQILYSCWITFIHSDNTIIPPVNPFGDVVVVGYPLGFYDFANNLPVYRKAMIASQYGINFNGKPYFLIDANLHPGTSGSPVISSHHTLFKENGFDESNKLFGIHSAEHIMEEEPLGLNVVWYSYLINELIDGKINCD